MKKIVSTLVLISFVLISNAQEKLSYFLPDDVIYNENIPTPEQFFNQQMGEWILTYDQVLYYLKEIADISERAIIYEYARTYENRPLVHLVFTSKENQKKLDELKDLHVKFSNPEENIPIEGVPLVVSLNYGVHGNESSPTNTSVLTAYYLAAAEEKKIYKLLDNTIIIIDPCLNPDGYTRHSTWANMHQSKIATGDDNSRQFTESWPKGRTNHYWFDLNRDYLLLVNPESKGRVAKFHEWKPNVITDHHEMFFFPNSTFFFQPGVPSRNNPLTPARTHELTQQIAKYHAQFLDKIGTLYYSEENFDDYFFGKGSTYPDINGGIGILFEQAGIGGRIRKTVNGLNELALAIMNHFTVTLSTLEASMNLHNELLKFQKDFYRSALELGEKCKIEAYVFGSETDKIKTQKFVDFLNQHQIEVYKSDNDIFVDSNVFKSSHSFVVPVKQKQFRLIKTIFEEVTTFQDSTFFDVSTWTLPYSFDIPFARLKSANLFNISNEPVLAIKIQGKVVGGKSNIGYLFRWNEYSTPKALYQLQKKELNVKVGTKTFSYEIENRKENFTYGTILIPISGQKLKEDQVFNLISNIAIETGIDFYSLKSGLSPKGIDLGSRSFLALKKPELLMFIGGSTNSNIAGEIWHLFDQRYQIPITCAESNRLKSMSLERYNTIILPGGSYREWDESDVLKIKRWTAKGGNIVLCKSDSSWAAGTELSKTQFVEKVQSDTAHYLKYIESSKEKELNIIGGAILKAKIDITHPLCYGYLKEDLAILKRGISVAQSLGMKYSEPIKFDKEPYISGWVSEENLTRIKEAPIVSVEGIGQGKLITYHENMNFRGIWLGTNKLFSNSVFFGSIIR